MKKEKSAFEEGNEESDCELGSDIDDGVENGILGGAMGQMSQSQIRNVKPEESKSQIQGFEEEKKQENNQADPLAEMFAMPNQN